MSVNYYCKIVSKDKKEIVASISCPTDVRDDVICDYQWDYISPEDEKNLPAYIIDRSERSNKLFVGRTDAVSFIDGNIEWLENEIKNAGAALENHKLKILLAKTKIAYEKIENEISYYESLIESNNEKLDAYRRLAHDIYYELDSRSCFYKNNKPVYRDKEYKYRNIKDYDLYFFWS